MFKLNREQKRLALVKALTGINKLEINRKIEKKYQGYLTTKQISEIEYRSKTKTDRTITNKPFLKAYNNNNLNKEIQSFIEEFDGNLIQKKTKTGVDGCKLKGKGRTVFGFKKNLDTASALFDYCESYDLTLDFLGSPYFKSLKKIDQRAIKECPMEELLLDAIDDKFKLLMELAKVEMFLQDNSQMGFTNEYFEKHRNQFIKKFKQNNRKSKIMPIKKS